MSSRTRRVPPLRAFLAHPMRWRREGCIQLLPQHIQHLFVDPLCGVGSAQVEHRPAHGPEGVPVGEQPLDLPIEGLARQLLLQQHLDAAMAL